MPDIPSVPVPGTCRYCGTALQSATATACIACAARNTVHCPTCSPGGKLWGVYRELAVKNSRGEEIARKQERCPTCGNERWVTLEPEASAGKGRGRKKEAEDADA